jgi:small subunit ribosomal protein S17
MVEDNKTKAVRSLEGSVASDKMNKTIVVSVVRRLKHGLYGKTINRSKKYKVHDEKNSAKIGDWVEFIESKPLSKTKHMELLRIVRRSS